MVQIWYKGQQSTERGARAARQTTASPGSGYGCVYPSSQTGKPAHIQLRALSLRPHVAGLWWWGLNHSASFFRKFTAFHTTESEVTESPEDSQGHFSHQERNTSSSVVLQHDSCLPWIKSWPFPLYFQENTVLCITEGYFGGMKYLVTTRRFFLNKCSSCTDLPSKKWGK